MAKNAAVLPMGSSTNCKKKMKNINSLFQQFKKNTPGCAVCVIQNNKILFKQCFGLANLENKSPITPDTAFRLASITKPFTAMAIMILKEQNKLDFDDPVTKFIPDFPAYGDNVTIRQLLTHTSGMPDHEAPLYKQIKKRGEPTIYDSLEILKKRRRLLFGSGKKYTYSDSGYVVLAIIIEIVSGLKYSAFLKKYIFKPLRMNNTIVLDETKPSINNPALGYKRKRNSWILYDYDPLNFIVGDEGIYSTIRDLAKWNRAWNTNVLVGKQVLGEALSPFVLYSGKNGLCGFSWFIDEKREIRFQDGFWVGFNNIMLTKLDTNSTVIMLSNTNEFAGEEKKVETALTILKKVL